VRVVIKDNASAKQVSLIGLLNPIIQRTAHHALRQACPCAQCRFLRIGTDGLHFACDVVVTEIRPMGYGLQLVFSDGHDRGIFPWPYLEASASRRFIARKSNCSCCSFNR
jgi:DUF971 family protein